MWTSLILSLLVTSTLLPSVMSVPSRFYVVELTQCGQTEGDNALAEQCVSVCEPIQKAQQLCHRNVACTCVTAPPLAVQACLRCLQADNQGAQSEDARNLISSRLDGYSHLCGDGLVLRGTSDVQTNSSSNEPPFTLDTRELSDTHCFYGLPDMTMSGPAVLLHSKWILWPLFAFFAVMILWVVDTRS